MTADRPPTPIETLLAEREWVRALARSLLADSNRADDVEQQTWLSAMRRPPAIGFRRRIINSMRSIISAC